MEEVKQKTLKERAKALLQEYCLKGKICSVYRYSDDMEYVVQFLPTDICNRILGDEWRARREKIALLVQIAHHTENEAMYNDLLNHYVYHISESGIRHKLHHTMEIVSSLLQNRHFTNSVSCKRLFQYLIDYLKGLYAQIVEVNRVNITGEWDHPDERYIDYSDGKRRMHLYCIVLACVEHNELTKWHRKRLLNLLLGVVEGMVSLEKHLCGYSHKPYSHVMPLLVYVMSHIPLYRMSEKSMLRVIRLIASMSDSSDTDCVDMLCKIIQKITKNSENPKILTYIFHQRRNMSWHIWHTAWKNHWSIGHDIDRIDPLDVLLVKKMRLLPLNIQQKFINHPHDGIRMLVQKKYNRRYQDIEYDQIKNH